MSHFSSIKTTTYRKVLATGLLCILLGLPTLKGQNRQNLEQDKQAIERDIQLTNQLLNQTKNASELSLNQLRILNQQIANREKLLRTLNNELTLINRQIQQANRDVDNLSKELEALKASYANMVYHAYKNRNSYQRLMFLFSSRDFNQAYLRLKYLQQLAKHRQLQAEKILETQQSLELQIAALEVKKKEQQQVLTEQRQELARLDEEKKEQARSVGLLQKKEKELLAQIRQQEQTARQLQQAIERVIAEERRKAAERAAEQARAQGRPATASPEPYRLTPAEQVISNRFADNKGKLPWPLERGIITGSFGQQPHPVLPGIRIDNPGVDISTTQGAKARAIFEGTVTRIFTVPGANYSVIIQHGDYRTVYSNLSEVFVTGGQKVNIRQEIGTVATDPRDARTHVQLQIWHGNNKLNPADWIARQR